MGQPAAPSTSPDPPVTQGQSWPGSPICLAGQCLPTPCPSCNRLCLLGCQAPGLGLDSGGHDSGGALSAWHHRTCTMGVPRVWVPLGECRSQPFWLPVHLAQEIAQETGRGVHCSPSQGKNLAKLKLIAEKCRLSVLLLPK